MNPGRRGGKTATNRLSYGAAYPVLMLIFLQLNDSFYLIFQCFYPSAFLSIHASSLLSLECAFKLLIDSLFKTII
jgi:hypothetical protein